MFFFLRWKITRVFPSSYKLLWAKCAIQYLLWKWVIGRVHGIVNIAVIRFYDEFSDANSSIRPNSILHWPSILLEWIFDALNHEYRRKQWASPWLLSDFDVVFSVSARLLSSIPIIGDLFACQTRRPMSRHQLWRVPWMWNRNWRDPAYLKRPAHGTVFEKNQLFLNKPCGEASHAQNIHKNRTNRLVRNAKVANSLSRGCSHGLAVFGSVFWYFTMIKL